MSAGSSSLMRRRSVSGGSRRRRIEVRHLAERVHAGVGAARALDLDGAPGASAIARCSSPWTVRAFCWICQPL